MCTQIRSINEAVSKDQPVVSALVVKKNEPFKGFASYRKKVRCVYTAKEQ
jgi:hypothetical protein